MGQYKTNDWLMNLFKALCLNKLNCARHHAAYGRRCCWKLQWPTSAILLWYICIAALPSCFSSLLSTFRLFQVLFDYVERFFCYAKHFLLFWAVFRLCQAVFRYAEPFSDLPTIFLLCWARLGSVKHFSAMLSTFRLYEAFCFYTERFLPLC